VTALEPAVGAIRKPGRPRDERADRAIIDAALEIFAGDGYHALSMEAVAARAGVSKATIYRRWAGKRELLIDALATLNDDFPTVPAAVPAPSTKARLLIAMRHMAGRDPNSLAGRIMPRMMVYSVSHPDLYAEYFDQVIMPRRRWLYAVLQDGIDSGELRADLDVELAAIALVGPILLHSHSKGGPRPDTELPDQLMAILWPGLRGDSDLQPCVSSRMPAASDRS